MHSEKFIFSQVASVQHYKTMFSGLFLLTFSNVLFSTYSEGQTSFLEVLKANVFFLWIAFCIMRLSAYSTISLAIIKEGMIQVMDCMLKDLGTYAVGDVKCYNSSESRDGVHRIVLLLPNVGKVIINVNNDASVTEIIQSGVTVSKTYLSAISHTLLLVSVLIALTITPVLASEVLHSLKQSAFSSPLLLLIITYFILLSSIVWLRLKTGIKIGLLLRRIL